MFSIESNVLELRIIRKRAYDRLRISRKRFEQNMNGNYPLGKCYYETYFANYARYNEILKVGHIYDNMMTERISTFFPNRDIKGRFISVK